MESLFNYLSLIAFNLIAWAKGYTFKKVTTDNADAQLIYDEEGFSFPEHLEEDIRRFKAGTLNYVAYHRGAPAGLVRLANPKVINRSYEHYGVDMECRHHEIQSLVVRPQYRDGAQFVMLGLIKKIYTYSLTHDVDTWSACGKRSVYLTMRKYCKGIEVVDVDFKSIDHPVTQYLVANNIVETYFTMQVAAFAPYQIFKRCVKQIVRKWEILNAVKNKISSPFMFKKDMELKAISK